MNDISLNIANNLQLVFYSFSLKPHYGLNYISENIEQISGYSKNDFNADPSFLSTIIHPDDKATFKNALLDQTESLMLVTLRWIKADGAIVKFRHYSRLVISDSNKVQIQGVAIQLPV